MAKRREKPRREERPSDVLRREVESLTTSPTAVAAAAGVPHTTLSRFLARERSMSLESFDALCLATGLYLTKGRGGLR